MDQTGRSNPLVVADMRIRMVYLLFKPTPNVRFQVRLIRQRPVVVKNNFLFMGFILYWHSSYYRLVEIIIVFNWILFILHSIVLGLAVFWWRDLTGAVQLAGLRIYLGSALFFSLFTCWPLKFQPPSWPVTNGSFGVAWYPNRHNCCCVHSSGC